MPFKTIFTDRPTAMVPKVGCTAPWGVLRGKGALEVGPSDHAVRLFTIELTLGQTLGN
jgi:hypothetical protein